MLLSINEEIIKRIKKLDLFSQSGKILNVKQNFNIVFVHSWKEAKSYYSDKIWSSTTLEARNVLTSFLSRNYPNEYQMWNSFSSELRRKVLTELIQKLDSFSQEKSLGEAFIKSVTWTILNAIMEDVYRDAVDRPTFFLNLLEIYEAGNFPCGWIGTWTEGTLVVY